MNNLNTVLIEGNLTKDPELSYTSEGTAVCRFTVANNRSYKKDDDWVKEVSFFDVSAWAKLAEVCGEFLKKGRGVRVVGRLKQERWETDGGEKRSKIVVYAEHVEFKPQLKATEGAAQEREPGEDT